MLAAIDQSIRGLIDFVVLVGHHVLLPTMAFVFVGAVILRVLVYYTVKRQAHFINEFHKRATRGLAEAPHGNISSFFAFSKKYLEKTFYELFVSRGIQMRRNLDFIMAPSDRIFLVQQGCAIMVRDLQRQLKSLRKNSHEPNFEQIAKSTIETNPAFGKLFGIFNIGAINDAMALLPGVFILAGIFGTFISIMKALPELSNLNMTDVEGTREAMASFVGKVSISMVASVCGIILSVIFSFVSSFWSAERSFISSVDKLCSTLNYLWSSSEGNQVPHNVKDFDANRDPLEALAESAIDKELENSRLHQEENPSPTIHERKSENSSGNKAA